MLDDSLIPEEELTIEEPADIVEGLPEELEGEISAEENIYEDLPIEEEIMVDPGEIVEEDPLINELVENENTEELAEVNNEQQEILLQQSDEVNDQIDQKAYEEEILSKIETLTTSVEVIQTNCKTGIENMQLLSTCSIGISSMIFGGFVIYCFVNRLG